jgi:hypothetical protein
MTPAGRLWQGYEAGSSPEKPNPMRLRDLKPVPEGSQEFVWPIARRN